MIRFYKASGGFTAAEAVLLACVLGAACIAVGSILSKGAASAASHVDEEIATGSPTHRESGGWQLTASEIPRADTTKKGDTTEPPTTKLFGEKKLPQSEKEVQKASSPRFKNRPELPLHLEHEIRLEEIAADELETADGQTKVQIGYTAITSSVEADNGKGKSRLYVGGAMGRQDAALHETRKMEALGADVIVEANALSTTTKATGSAGIADGIVGVKAEVQADANLIDAKANLTWGFGIPLTSARIELAVTPSAAVGLNVGGHVDVGYFRENGQSHVGIGLGAKGAVGVGAGVQLGLNIVW